MLLSRRGAQNEGGTSRAAGELRAGERAWQALRARFSKAPNFGRRAESQEANPCKHCQKRTDLNHSNAALETRARRQLARHPALHTETAIDCDAVRACLTTTDGKMRCKEPKETRRTTMLALSSEQHTHADSRESSGGESASKHGRHKQQQLTFRATSRRRSGTRSCQ